MKHSSDLDYLVLNPDTLWSENYINEINKMINLYFLRKLDNILLVTNKKLSFDKDLKGDFNFENNLLLKKDNKNFIYLGCQILNRNLFSNYEIGSFSISEVWNNLLKNNKLNGFESSNKFFHLTNLDIFKKLKDF
tara:strand:+ start:800 stop:1204 length:405 start_codon:yes stop_codon:yes gene_type:complete